MHLNDANMSGSRDSEAVARANLLRMPPLKWRLIRIFESLMQFLKPLIPPLRPIKNPKDQPASILVIEYWNLGDLAILVPFLHNLRRSFPRTRISLLLKAELTTFLEDQGLVDEFIPVRVPWALFFNRFRKYNPFSLDWISLARTILQLRKHRFDWAFSGRPDVRNNFLLWLSGARRRIGYGFAGGGCFLTDCVPPDLTRPHRSDLWLHLLEALGASPDRREVRFRLKASDLSFAQSYLAGLGIPTPALLVGVHPGARIATRRWGADRFAEVARRLVKETDAHILWFNEPGASLQAPHLQRCHSVSLDLQQFLAVLSQCGLLVCNDSGPMHLANLVGLPVVAVFGPQKPEWYGPRGPRDRVVIQPEFSCRPCWDSCVFDRPYCLRAISVDEVHDAAKNQINRILNSERTGVSSADTAELASRV
jgi:heptosyltransferase-2